MAPYILGVLKDDDILPILKEMSRQIKRKRINLKKYEREADIGEGHCPKASNVSWRC
jgi:hypothetical protein